MTRLDEVRWADARVGERQALVSADVLGEPITPAKRAGTERAVRAQPEADQLKECSSAALSKAGPDAAGSFGRHPQVLPDEGATGRRGSDKRQHQILVVARSRL